MTGDAFPSPFELATIELRALGITIARLPGEYRVNYRNGAEATARTVETLDEALAIGRELAAGAPAAPATRGKRRRRPLRMTPKAVNKRRRLAHMRRMRARAIRQDKEK
jgi:hypothetical protein